MAVLFPFVNGDFRGWENLVGPHKKTSVVFYIGFGIAVQTILSVVTAAGIRIDVDPDFWADPPAAVLLSYVIWGTAAWSVLECAAYYILTLLTLKKRLNLQ